MIFFVDPLSSFAVMYSSKPTQTSGKTIQGSNKASLNVSKKDNIPLPDNFTVYISGATQIILKIFFVTTNGLINY